MKSKINLFGICVFFISFFQSYGQERVNRQKLVFELQSEILSSSIGWAYNEKLGEWVDYQNVISFDKDYKEKYQSLLGEYMMSHNKQNFSNIQIKTITFNNVKYFVLIVDKWGGRFRYPAISKDWQHYKVTEGYLFTKSEYDKLFNIENIIELKTKYLVKMYHEFDKFDEVKFLDLIQTELTKKLDKYSAEYKFPLSKTKEGKVRFLLPDSFSKYFKYDFNKQYFEAEYLDFQKLQIK